MMVGLDAAQADRATAMLNANTSTKKRMRARMGWDIFSPPELRGSIAQMRVFFQAGDICFDKESDL
jgi:hypothetical protein